MRWRVVVAGGLMAASLAVEAEAVSRGRPAHGDTGSRAQGSPIVPSASQVPQAPAGLILPPHLTGGLPQRLPQGSERAVPTLQDAEWFAPTYGAPPPPRRGRNGHGR